MNALDLLALTPITGKPGEALTDVMLIFSAEASGATWDDINRAMRANGDWLDSNMER